MLLGTIRSLAIFFAVAFVALKILAIWGFATGRLRITRDEDPDGYP